MTLSAETYSDSLWWRRAAEPAVPSDAPEEALRPVDVAVIGGGFTGLSAALHLAEAGRSVTVIEARHVGFGASGRNGGQVIPGIKIDPDEIMARWGPEAGARALDFVGTDADLVFDLIDRHAIACAPRRKGWIQAAHSTRALGPILARARQWERQGAPIEILDRDAIAAATGTEAYFGGWRDLRAGVVQPLAFARGLARAAQAAGARILQDTQAAAPEPDGDGWRIATPHGTLRARAVIVAANAYGEGLIPGLSRSVLQVQSTVIATEPLSPNVAASVLPAGACVSETRKLAFYFRKEDDGRLVFGGRGAVGADYATDLARALEDGMRRMYPQIGDAAVAHEWSGHLALTLDHLPHLHTPAPGLFAALGYNGRGLALATATGRALARHIAEGAPLPIPASAIRPVAWHGVRAPVMNAGIRFYWLKDRLGFAS
ncbi:sarcosine oxidase [Albimonas donghaensis]|uniref:Sarcosine oxidase n=1 Tax=Albimonas donghaensis TaxID=356660 RepID=A0A1H2R4R4_9RHOB|nr:FAD-binding oxidoreductase [Albimonas donghaensis]SDW14130.1 sarcosine oxidase [Albimonas donghaensis]